MEPWVLDAVKALITLLFPLKCDSRIAGATLGILALSFGFIFMLVFMPWARCRKHCSRKNTDDLENQSARPSPYYSIISELLTVSSANSPTLPTYEQCNEQTLPPSFSEAVVSDQEQEEAVPPYSPPEPGTPASEELPPVSLNVIVRQNPDECQVEENHSHADTCLQFSPPDCPPPPYT
ncbi:hypothetical protein FGIG_03468 [Fasciola gigantica]|uniref:Uncharacterized protein n=1 Tax=Fasciola gigantica TaxID=46835 RepID=A0A504YLT9_FASGI|nr:hypothetical protein FGIG_03468 [Fasciola gigantica]